MPTSSLGISTPCMEARIGTVIRSAASTAPAATGPGRDGGRRASVTMSASARCAASSSAAVNTAEPLPPGSRTSSAIRPAASAARAVSRTSAREAPITATRLPAGSGCEVSSSATSNACEMRSTPITPACRSRASSRAERPGVHGHDRLAPAEAAGQPGELARVAERLQVHDHRVGLRVLLPVLEQVVAADVGPVPRRDEHGQPPPRRPPAGSPHRTGRTASSSRPRPAGGICGAINAFSPPAGFWMPMLAGPDDPHAAGPRLGGQGGVGGVVPLVGEHDQAPHPGPPARGDDPGHLGRRHAHHGQVDRAGHLLDAAVGADRGDRGAGRRGGRVHRVHRPVETTGEQVAQHRVTQGTRGAGGADDGDRPGMQQPTDGGRLRPMFTGAHHRDRLLGGGDLERQPDGTGVPGPRDGVTGVEEDPDHLPVLAEHVGVEPTDAAIPGRGGEVLQQHRAETPALLGVLHQEGHLRLGRPGHGALPVRHGDEIVTDHGDDGAARPLVHHGHPVDVGVTHRPTGGEETEVDRLGGQPRPEPPKQRAVGRQDRPDVGRAAVGEDDIGLPLRRVRQRRVVPARGRQRRGAHRATVGSRPCRGSTSRRVAATARSSGSSGSPSPASQGR